MADDQTTLSSRGDSQAQELAFVAYSSQLSWLRRSSIQNVQLVQRHFKTEAATLLEQKLSSDISTSSSWPSSIHSWQPCTTSGDAIISDFGSTQPQQARRHPHANGSSTRNNREGCEATKGISQTSFFYLRGGLGGLFFCCFLGVGSWGRRFWGFVCQLDEWSLLFFGFVCRTLSVVFY